MTQTQTAHCINYQSAAVRSKWLWTVLATLGFCVPYFLLQRFPLGEPQVLPLFLVDRVVGFDPHFAWWYQSAYLLIFGVPWLLRSNGELDAWLRGFICICVPSFLVLAVAPVAAPRPNILPAEGMFAILISYDGSVNCMPSLHAALAVFSAALGYHSICSREKLDSGRRLVFAALLFVWVGLILYSTLATKQHYCLDLLPGVLLGCVAYYLTVSYFESSSNETD